LLGVPAEAIQALEYAHYYYLPTDETCIVLAISSSGNTPRALEAVYRARESGAFTIGVTTSQPSAMTTETDASLVARAARGGWPTQTSTASMAAMILLAVRLAEARGTASAAECKAVQDGLAGLPEQVQQALERSDRRMAELGEELRNAPIQLFSGGGPALAAALFGAAKVKELCPVHAFGMPLEEYHHYRAQKPGDPLFLVAPGHNSARRELDTVLESERVGGRTIALVCEGNVALAGHGSELLELPRVHSGMVGMAFAAPLHLYSYHLALAKFRYSEGYPPRGLVA
jgi:glucosamine--fructose-6-phosphate aminotransferase (isomerizing)